MNNKRLLSILLSLFLILLAVPAYANGIPPLPQAFYGDITIADNPAPVGTVISAKVNGEDCGSFTTTEVGLYGGSGALDHKLVVQDDISSGDTIIFYINGVQANQTYSFSSGRVTELNLSVDSTALPPSPADFYLTDLSISPTTVKAGEVVSISARVTNSGGTQGNYTAYLIINGITNEARQLILNSGQSQIITFSIARNIIGGYTVRIGDLNGQFTVEPAEALPPPPANFSISDLSISPDKVKQGHTVTISIKVTNSGGAQGSHTVILKVNGIASQTRKVTLAPDKSQTVTFSVTKKTSGTYTVEVSNLRGNFNVTGNSEQSLPPPEMVTEPEATFTISNFTTTTDVGPQKATIITAVITNTGSEKGSYSVGLKVDGAVAQDKKLTLEPGASQTITFTISQEITTSPVVDETPSDSKTDWLFIGATATIVVLIGFIIFIARRRRARY